MLDKSTLIRGVISLLFVGIDLYALVNWIRGKGVLAWEHIGAPEYIFAIFICTTSLFVLNRSYLNKFSPKYRFKELEPLLEKLDDSSYYWKSYIPIYYSAKIQELCGRLDDLKINHPRYIHDEKFDSREWKYFIPILLAHCRQGKIRPVRKKWPSVFNNSHNDNNLG